MNRPARFEGSCERLQRPVADLESEHFITIVDTLDTLVTGY